MKRVIIESPYAGDVSDNLIYARRALYDSLMRGEAPLASHLLYTQVLMDSRAGERILGVEAGYSWMEKADLIAFYVDLGWSNGMRLAQNMACHFDIPCEARSICG